MNQYSTDFSEIVRMFGTFIQVSCSKISPLRTSIQDATLSYLFNKSVTTLMLIIIIKLLKISKHVLSVVSGHLCPRHLCPAKTVQNAKSVQDIWFPDKIVQAIATLVNDRINLISSQ